MTQVAASRTIINVHVILVGVISHVTLACWQGCQKVPKYAPFLKQVANLAIFYERIREKPSKDME